MTTTKLLFVHALSPLHAGTGQSIGAIDLAIARDRATQFPYLPGSSLKGSLRDVAEQKHGRESSVVTQLFGPDTKNASEHAGALIVSDANLLLLPVRSIAGTFAWVTSPYLLHRFLRDASAASEKFTLPTLPDKVEGCVIGSKSKLVATDKGNGKVIFEDLDLEPIRDASADTFADELGKKLFPGSESTWQKLFTEKLCIVHDDVMTFLSEHATDVVARIALEDDAKTVRKGGLWYEENLPTESILVSLLSAQLVGKLSEATPANAMKHAQALIESALTESTIQLGGKATVGRGRCRLQLVGVP